MDVPESLLRRLDVPGPRCTSCPTADRFVEAFGPAEYRQALSQRAQGAVVGGTPRLSVYGHLPFCGSVRCCCACNKVITRHHERSAEDLDALDVEIDLHVAGPGEGKAVSQLHFGGGSPTFLSDDELARVMASLRRAFRLAPGVEVSIEGDPRTAWPGRLRYLAGLDFNRINFGIQDFDPQVQQAVHRGQSFDRVRDLISAAGELGFEAINADRIYRLPTQTPESFARMIAQDRARSRSIAHDRADGRVAARSHRALR